MAVGYSVVVHRLVDYMGNGVDYFEADIFAFFVAVEPEDYVVGTACFFLQKCGHFQIRRRFFLHCFCVEQFSLFLINKTFENSILISIFYLRDRLCPNY